MAILNASALNIGADCGPPARRHRRFRGKKRGRIAGRAFLPFRERGFCAGKPARHACALLRGEPCVKRIRRMLGLVLLASLCVTMGLLVLEGRWREAIPLHLCSLSALSALALARRPRAALLDFLWYLGMPGALLALLFPAPAVSRWQALLNLSYFTTHALILLIPLCAMTMGERPRAGRTPAMMAALQGIALAAFWVNQRLGTDFLFLMAPPAGTPLEAVFHRGYGIYLLFLEGMMLALCMLMDALCARMFGFRARGAGNLAK